MMLAQQAPFSIVPQLLPEVYTQGVRETGGGADHVSHNVAEKDFPRKGLPVSPAQLLFKFFSRNGFGKPISPAKITSYGFQQI